MSIVRRIATLAHGVLSLSASAIGFLNSLPRL